MTPNEFIAVMLSGARRGDTTSAKMVIDFYIKLVKSGASVPPDILEYLAQILDSARWDPDHAARHLGLKARRPGSRGRLFKPAVRDLNLSWLVKYEMHAGATLETAVATVAELVPWSESTVKKAYLRMLPTFEKTPGDYDSRTTRDMYLALLNKPKAPELFKKP